MILCGLALLLLSLLFFVLWQYFPQPWLLVVHILAVLGVCGWFASAERRMCRRMLDRFERILHDGNAGALIDEALTPTERRLILRLCELETREAQVQKHFRGISTLVSDIAHQSKTPLSSILMYTELSGGRYADTIRAQTEKLKFLMESLTALAKCEGGLIAENLAPAAHPVTTLLCRVIEGGYAAAEEKRMEIRCDIPRGLCARFDLRWTAEAVSNILDNAIKYSPTGSTVTIRATEYDLFVRIDITDCGGGIPEEALCHIWKRFYRGKNAADKPGVGIGLYLTACILRAQGGNVSVSSDSGGSTFSVFLSKL